MSAFGHNDPVDAGEMSGDGRNGCKYETSGAKAALGRRLRFDSKGDQVERLFSLLDPVLVFRHTHSDGGIARVEKTRHAAGVDAVTVGDGELLVVAEGKSALARAIFGRTRCLDEGEMPVITRQMVQGVAKVCLHFRLFPRRQFQNRDGDMERPGPLRGTAGAPAVRKLDRRTHYQKVEMHRLPAVIVISIKDARVENDLSADFSNRSISGTAVF